MFTVQLTQQNLRNLNDSKWLQLVLSKPRVISPFAPLTPAEERFAWVARESGENYHLWGRWSLGTNSVTNMVDRSKTLGASAPDDCAWRWSWRTYDLEFVELHHISDGTPTGTPTPVISAVLYGAGLVRGGIMAPVRSGNGVGTGFVSIGSGILTQGSITWEIVT